MSTPSKKKNSKTPQFLTLSTPSPSKTLKLFTSKSISSKKSPSKIFHKRLSHHEVPLTDKKFSRTKQDSSEIFPNSIENMFPTHLEVIERIRKIKNLNSPMPFSPKIPPPDLPYGKKSTSLEKRIQKRKNHIEFVLPKEPGLMNEFLQRIKETERIIRQEDEFIGKVRIFKPKIQLINSGTLGEETMAQKRIKRKRKNSPPVSALRTGIVLHPSSFY